MNRPQKKKNSDPLLPEENVVDERNLIDVEDSAELSVEDRISMYWMENKGFIIGCITALAFALIALNGLRIYKDHSIENLKADYANALAEETLESFAEANANKELGGVAALAVADQAFEAETYEKAIQFYQIASGALEDGILSGRAQLGEAFALYQNGQTSEGIAQLSAIAANESLAESVRGEAAYHLALEADLNGNNEAYDAYVAQIESMPLASSWQQRLSFHQQSR